MKLYSPDGSELMHIVALEQADGRLVIKGSAFGSMPITANLRPEEMRSGMKMLNAKLVFFLIGLLLKRSK
tara:strand:+ start:1668 stop:1877 length:210 start_codon:yes stop_codon:yes gene_type:complete